MVPWAEPESDSESAALPTAPETLQALSSRDGELFAAERLESKASEELRGPVLKGAQATEPLLVTDEASAVDQALQLLREALSAPLMLKPLELRHTAPGTQATANSDLLRKTADIGAHCSPGYTAPLVTEYDFPYTATVYSEYDPISWAPEIDAVGDPETKTEPQQALTSIHTCVLSGADLGTSGSTSRGNVSHSQ